MPKSFAELSLNDALAKVRDAPFLLDAIRSSGALRDAARRDGGPFAVKLLARVVQDDADELTGIAAVHALGAVFDEGAGAVLSRLLSDPRPFLREHAAMALGTRLPRLDAVGRLVSGVAAGGFATVINQRALRRWARVSPDHIALTLEGALVSRDDAAGRARLIETMGLVPGSVAAGALLRIAGDAAEPLRSRQAAIAALGDRRDGGPGGELVRRLARTDGELAGVAKLAAFDLAGASYQTVSGESGLAIAQLFLHADLDRQLSRAGAGDNGGIATMLVRLGDTLAAQPGISRVLTMSRGSADAAVEVLTDPSSGHVLSPIPLMNAPTDAANAWPFSVAAERGIRRALTSHGRVDVVHLRMADVGSMAAARVAGRLGIPTVFTLAPDPHAVIHALDMTGALTRSSFGVVDEREHYWFRTGLVARLAAGARHRVLFPRPNLREQLRDLLGIDVDHESTGYTVVPEGIDVSVTNRARADLLADRAAAGPIDLLTRRAAVGGAVAGGAVADPAAGGAGAGSGLMDSLSSGRHPALAELASLVSALPGHRRGLPLALSVGRLHRVKGMVTLVEAWASDPGLLDRCNLLIVGGDVAHPSADERGQLELIAGVVAENPGAAAGLLVPGHRPNDVIARWMAAAQLGLDDVVAPGGVYLCGSLKEEFGLALIEALAAGLVVVAPDGGGPATYIEEGVTGFLVDTRSPLAVAAGARAAFDLVAKPGGAERVLHAQRTVEDRFTLRAMAETLAGVYSSVTAPAVG